MNPNIEQIFNRLDAVLTENFKFAKEVFGQREVGASEDLFPFFMQSYYERITYSLESVRMLFPSCSVDLNFETPIGLMLRANLLDSIIIFYIVSRKPEEINEEEIIKEIVADQVKFDIGFLKTAYGIGTIDQLQFNQALEFIFADYNFLFKGNNSIENLDAISKVKNVSVPKMCKKIYENNQTRFLFGIFDIYTYYSKYEHFSIRTYQLQLQGQWSDIYCMASAVRYSLFGELFALTLINKDATILEKLLSMCNESSKIVESVLSINRE